MLCPFASGDFQNLHPTFESFIESEEWSLSFTDNMGYCNSEDLKDARIVWSSPCGQETATAYALVVLLGGELRVVNVENAV
jgi:hypothetical protein